MVARWFGKLSCPGDGWHTFAEDQLALLDHLGIERCLLLGRGTRVRGAPKSLHAHRPVYGHLRILFRHNVHACVDTVEADEHLMIRWGISRASFYQKMHGTLEMKSGSCIGPSFQLRLLKEATRPVIHGSCLGRHTMW